jgi:hypothetical protein
MNKADTKESEPLVDRVLAGLLLLVASSGRPGSDARTLIGDVRADLESLLRNDALGPRLDECFESVRLTGASRSGFTALRVQIEATQPVSLGAVLMKNSCVLFCLTVEAEIIADTKFVSRQDIDSVKSIVNVGFAAAEEIAADDMDQMTYRALIELHAAVTNFLSETARPLPRVTNYRFADFLPSLVLAYKLYQDAGRADEIRAENKIIHPAFCSPTGVALSA